MARKQVAYGEAEGADLFKGLHLQITLPEELGSARRIERGATGRRGLELKISPGIAARSLTAEAARSSGYRNLDAHGFLAATPIFFPWTTKKDRRCPGPRGRGSGRERVGGRFDRERRALQGAVFEDTMVDSQKKRGATRDRRF